MLLAAVCTLMTSQAQPEVRLLPIRGDRVAPLELVTANERFVWVRIERDGLPLSGGAGLYRIDLRDGGIHTAGAFSQLTPTVSATNVPRPRVWGGNDLIVANGVLSEARAVRPFNVRVQAATEWNALVTLNGKSLLWSPGKEPVPLGYDISSRSVALRDGRLASNVVRVDGGSGLLIISSDGTPSFRPRTALAGRLGTMLVFETDEGVVTEGGARLGDVAVFQGDDPGQTRLIVASRDGGLWATDATSAGTTRLRTRLGEVQFSRTVVGATAVVFRRTDGGLLVESLRDGARFDNPGAPPDTLRFEWGRVLLDRSDLVVLADGGLERASDGSGCRWRRFQEDFSESYCLKEEQLLRRPTDDAAPEVVVTDLHVAEPMATWTAAARTNLDRGLFFFDTAASHWSNGVESYSLLNGERLLQEVGDRLLVARDGFTLIDRNTNEKQALGLARVVRALRASRNLFLQFPQCRVRWLSARGEVETLWEDGCVDEVAETAGGTLLLARQGHGLVDFRRPGVVPLSTDGEAIDLRQRALAFFGDTVWATTPAGSVVAIDTITGTTSGRVPVSNVTFNRVGAIGGARDITWFALDGGSWPFPRGSDGPFLALSDEAGWLVNDRGVHVTTGGPPRTIDGLDAGDWRPPAFAIGTRLVRPVARGLEALDSDGSRRQFEVALFDPDLPIVLQGRLWFAAFDEEHGVEPWFFDGQEARMVADLVPGPNSSYPRFLGAVPRGVLVQAGRADGTIGAVSLLTEPELAAPAEQLAFSGGGCAASPVAAPLMLFLLSRPRRSRSRP